MKTRIVQKKVNPMVAATSVTTQPVVDPPTAPDQEVDRYEAVRQYSLREILAVWAAAAVPMGAVRMGRRSLARRTSSGAMSRSRRRC